MMHPNPKHHIFIFQRFISFSKVKGEEEAENMQGKVSRDQKHKHKPNHKGNKCTPPNLSQGWPQSNNPRTATRWQHTPDLTQTTLKLHKAPANDKMNTPIQAHHATPTQAKKHAKPTLASPTHKTSIA